MIQRIVCVFFLMIAISTSAQLEKLNEYKYLIIKDKFDFLKERDQYQTSSLTKFLLKKNGFTVYLSNEDIPKEVIQNNCDILKVYVIEESSMFTIKNKIIFKNCFDKEIYSTDIGKSKIKEYKRGYHEAIRNAHKSMANFKYSYSPKNNESRKNIVDNTKTIIRETIKKEVPVKVVPLNKPKTEITTATIKETISKNPVEILYAQEKPNGFQLVNTKPEIVFQVIETAKEQVFIIKDKNGILFKNGNNWVAQFYENNQLITKKYNIKF